jgi:PAS domain S-box-containing protein
VVRVDGTALQGRDSREPNTVRRVLAHPVNFISVPVCVLFAIFRQFGFVVDVPLWLLVGPLLVTHLCSTAFTLRFPPGTPQAKPIFHCCFEIAFIGVIIYTIGWGAVLALGLIFSAAKHLSDDGSRVGTAAIVTSVLTIATGEIAIAQGWLPTLLPEPQGHGMAALVAVGVGVVIWMMSYNEREKEQLEITRRRGEERLRALVRYASDAIVVVDTQGAITYASPALERLLGYRPQEISTFDQSIVHADDLDATRSVFEDVARRPREVAWIQHRLLHGGGRYRWCEVAITNLVDDPAVGGYVCNMRDVTERRSAQQQLTFQAHHDALTRLPNRWCYLEQLERAQRAAQGRDCYIAVLFVDVDRFKVVNDTLGHEVGDEILFVVSERIGSCLRANEMVARFGGDEFTVLLADLRSADEAYQSRRAHHAPSPRRS